MPGRSNARKTSRSAAFGAGCLLVSVFWIGLIAGISFIATPAKFGAPSLSLAVALDVGRTTFHVFNNIEWVMFAFLAGTAALSGGHWWSRIATALVGLVLLAQTIWLLPALSHRVSAIIAGGMVVPSSDHFLYIAADFAKIALLATIAWFQGLSFST